MYDRPRYVADGAGLGRHINLIQHEALSLTHSLTRSLTHTLSVRVAERESQDITAARNGVRGRGGRWRMRRRCFHCAMRCIFSREHSTFAASAVIGRREADGFEISACSKTPGRSRVCSKQKHGARGSQAKIVLNVSFSMQPKPTDCLSPPNLENLSLNSPEWF